MSKPIRYMGEMADSDPDEAIEAEAFDMMSEAGVYIDNIDPEASSIDYSTPYKYLKSVERAIQLKIERTQPELPNRLTYTTPTNLGSYGATVSAEYLTNRLMELQKHPSKNFNEIMKITKELDRMLGK
jgi:hypothetical protein